MAYRRVLVGAGIGLAVLVAAACGLWLYNSVPDVPRISAAEAANPTRPFVVKLHANWCPICLQTKQQWQQLADSYAGRVNLLVFDSTSEDSIAGSRAEAEALGLREALDDYHGASGMILVIDPVSREVIAELAGVLPADAYASAIDAALGSLTRG